MGGIFLFLIIFLAVGPVHAKEARLLLNQAGVSGQVVRQALESVHGSDLRGDDGPMRKAGHDLATLLAEYRSQQALRPGRPFRPAARAWPVRDSLVLVDIAADGDSAALMVRMKGLGLQDGAVRGRIVSGYLPIASLEAAAAEKSVRSIRPSYRVAWAGTVTSQGDIAMQADLARAVVPGYTGTGVTVGVLSDSYSGAHGTLTRARDDIRNGDLPEDVEVLQDYNGLDAIDEGRAMMQIVHDVAPGSPQKFHTAFQGIAGFANGIVALRDAGCDVIVDDVIYFAEPFFQDGTIAQAVDTVVSSGAVYFSSAGNNGSKSYQSAFVTASGVTGPNGGDLHDFDPGAGVDALQAFTVPVGASVSIVFQWDEPFFSVSGAPGSASDIDIILVGSGSGTTNIVAYGWDYNVGSDPIEILQFSNNGTVDVDGTPGADTQFNLLLERYEGPAPGLMKYVLFTSGAVAVNEYAQSGSTVYGHANAAGANAVGAVYYLNTPPFGVGTPVRESYSSKGGTPILFDTSGTRLVAAEDRIKPEICAPDGGNTTFFYEGVDPESDGFPNFFGTSAAAPHAGGVAALMLERAGGGGSLTPDRVRERLTATAIDMAAAGFDYETGYGLVDALAAIENSPQDYGIWTNVVFASAPGGTDTTLYGDPDGDGELNLYEYFTGDDPLMADGSPIVAVYDAGQESVQYMMSKAAFPEMADLEKSVDLVSWTVVPGVTPQVVADLGDAVVVEVDLPPMDADTSAYYRLRVLPP